MDFLTQNWWYRCSIWHVILNFSQQDECDIINQIKNLIKTQFRYNYFQSMNHFRSYCQWWTLTFNKVTNLFDNLFLENNNEDIFILRVDTSFSQVLCLESRSLKFLNKQKLFYIFYNTAMQNRIMLDHIQKLRG